VVHATTKIEKLMIKQRRRSNGSAGDISRWLWPLWCGDC